MGAYSAIWTARFRTLIQYRAAAFGGLVTQFFFGFIYVMVYEAFYASATTGQPIALSHVITLVWLGQALLGMLPWNVDPEVKAMVRSGSVSYELLRPVDLYGFWYARALAQRTAPTLLRAVPLVIVCGLFFGLRPPASAASAGAFAAALLGSLLLGCAITVLFDVTLLWTVSGEGIVSIATSLVVVLSGMNVPLPFFPDWLQPVLRALPFRGLIDTPFRLYTGDIPPSDLPWMLLHQAAWTALLVVAGRLLMKRGLRRLSVQGG